MQPPPKNDRKSSAKGGTARDHGDYVEDEASGPEPRPREEGDYHDPGKRLTGPGNASKGPWKEQGGTGHGENYGARNKDRSSRTGERGRDKT
jgi:hypothetical protein